MNKRIESTSKQPKILVDTSELATLLSVGRDTAKRIGIESNSIVRLGRRKLYNLEKVMDYVNSIASNH